MRSQVALGIAGFALCTSVLFHVLPLFYLEAHSETDPDRFKDAQPQHLWWYGMTLEGFIGSDWWTDNGDGHAVDRDGYMRAAGVLGALATVAIAAWFAMEAGLGRNPSTWRWKTAIVGTVLQALALVVVLSGITAVAAAEKAVHGASTVTIRDFTPIQGLVILSVTLTAGLAAWEFWAARKATHGGGEPHGAKPRSPPGPP